MQEGSRCVDMVPNVLLEGSESDVLTAMSKGLKICENGFIKACERGFKEVIKILIGPVADGILTFNVNYKDANGVSGFLRACSRGQLEIVQMLHKHCIASKDNCDCNAAHYAANGGHLDVLCFLSEVGFKDFDQQSRRGRTPLHFACKGGHTMSIRYLLTLHGADVTLQDRNGDTPIHLVFQGELLVDYSEILHLLIDYGANVNVQNKRGITPLHMAAEQNLVPAVKALLEQRADPAEVDKYGVSPIIAASVSGSGDVIPLLHSEGASVNSKDNSGRTSFHAACSEGHYDVVKVLVELKASQSSQDKEGNIPLQLACHRGQFDIAKYLIETGQSDIHSQDRNGQTPMHKACKGKDSKERSQLLHYLIEKGGNVNLQSKYYRSPLHCACQDGNPDAAEILLQAGANVQLADRDKQTPLHYASFGGFSKFPTYNKLLGILLQYNANANQPGDHGMTAVHIAARRGNIEALKLLLDYSGSPNTKCENGRTAVHYAVLGDPPKADPSYEAVKILLDHGGEANEPDSVHGNTPVHYAAKGGHCAILQLLLQRGVNELRFNKWNQQPSDLAMNVSVNNILMVAKMQLKYSMQEVIPLPTVKIFLTGHIEAGKTALRHHLGKSKYESRPSLHQRTEKRRQRTAGVEIENLEHDAYGSVVAYDLAGHCEYTASHSVVIDCGSNSIFLILFDVTGKLSKMKKEVNYWAAFIKAGRLKSCRPTVILVATHCDKALESGKTVKELKTIYSCIFDDVLQKDYKDVFSLKNEKFIINCLDSTTQQMDDLRKAIGSSCEDIKKAHPKIPVISLTVLNEMKTMSNEQQQAIFLVDDVVRYILQKSKNLAQEEEAKPGTIFTLLQYLSVMGMILLLHQWVIIDLETVLEDVLGFIFAPDEFFTEDLSECEFNGLLPWSRLENLFPFKANIVATILTELRLGVLLPDNSAIQIPGLLRDIHMKSSVLEDNNEYAQYAGLRFALKLKTDIFSHSSFPKLQVTMLQKHGEKVQLWTHGLCCIINEVQVVIYMDEEKQSIDIVLRSETLNEKGCYLVREELRRIVKDELRDSSAGSEYIEQLLRPADLRNRSRNFQAYDLHEVLDHHIQKKMSITLDGLQVDSVQELLFCNYLEIDDEETDLTYPQLVIAAKKLCKSSSWIIFGAEIGLKKEDLDRIDIDTRGRRDNEQQAAYEMLCLARERNLLSTPSQLIRALLQSDKKTLARELTNLFDIPCSLNL